MRFDRWIRLGFTGTFGFSVALAGGIGVASAAPVANLSRASINFGGVPAVVAIVQPVFVTNTGDAPLTLSGISLTGANPSDFALGGTCGAPVTLAPGGGRCRIDVSSQLAPGGSSTRFAQVVIASNASPGVPNVFVSASYAFEIVHGMETTPSWLDFAGQAIGTSAPTQTFTIGAHERIAIIFDRVALSDGDATDFSLSTNCAAGAVFVVGGSPPCTTTVGFRPTSAGPRSTELEFFFHFQGGTASANSLSYRYSVTGIGGAAGPGPVGVDLNQHGLTGSWYEPATSGQGFEVEVFPDLSAPGTGLTQVSWFTYDTVVGGADRQRWYTLSGPVVSGQPTAALTIYRNTGGNFNAPPVTSATAVGTATLSFDSCTSGQIAYTFSEGSGRTGTIPLTRLTQNVTCSTGGARTTNADFAHSGNWYDAATSGQGFTVEVNPVNGLLFFAWYTYAPNGAGSGAAGQRWYTGQEPNIAAGARTIPLQLYETTGGQFDMPTTPAPATAAVGTGTLAFQSCTSATLSYTFTGGSSSGASGTITLSRIGPVPQGCV